MLSLFQIVLGSLIVKFFNQSTLITDGQGGGFNGGIFLLSISAQWLLVISVISLFCLFFSLIWNKGVVENKKLVLFSIILSSVYIILVWFRYFFRNY
jgi:hypothetical protein